MAIERISELPWASFEAQLIQKCATYLFQDHSSPAPESYPYWNTYGESVADETYCIQQQIIFNAVALNDELGRVQGADVSGDRADDREVFFWNDLVQTKDENGFTYLHIGYDNTYEGRSRQSEEDPLFKKNPSFMRDKYDTEDDQTEKTNLLTSLPKTHAAKALIEVSEYYGPNNPESKHSNYVSRKVSMLWFFNVIKAIAKAIRVFQWMRIGVDTDDCQCRHDEAEKQYDEPNNRTIHGTHTFKRSKSPATDGSLKVYGNAQFNGDVSTFHSQARFHDEVTMWDKLSVYGQSYFSKDINGTTMRTRWGDLAEYYRADRSYEPGTLVVFGGSEEVTVAVSSANAVVTSNPGLVLNEQLKMKGEVEFPVGIALVGRVPVKVFGKCRKFDALVSDPEHPGWARVQVFDSERVVARALEDKDDSGNLVLCATNFNI